MISSSSSSSFSIFGLFLSHLSSLLSVVVFAGATSAGVVITGVVSAKFSSIIFPADSLSVGCVSIFGSFGSAEVSEGWIGA